MLKKLLVALVASMFALGAFAQAPKSDTAKTDTPKAEKKAKGEKKAKAEKKSKAKSKSAKDEKKDAAK